MFTLSPKRLGRALLAPAAVGLTALACLWVGTAAIAQHTASARFARADLLQTAIDLSHHELQLVAANKVSYSSARAAQIDLETNQLMQLLRAADHAWGQGRPMKGLSSRYGTDILLADSPAHASRARNALVAVASTAKAALAAEGADALQNRPREGVSVLCTPSFSSR